MLLGYTCQETDRQTDTLITLLRFVSRRRSNHANRLTVEVSGGGRKEEGMGRLTEFPGLSREWRRRVTAEFARVSDRLRCRSVASRSRRDDRVCRVAATRSRDAPCASLDGHKDDS